MNDWDVEPRPVPAELEQGFDHGTFPPPPVAFNPIEAQMNAADREALRLYANGVTGPGSWRNTEIGGE